jgi:hypothetical protein
MADRIRSVDVVEMSRKCPTVEWELRVAMEILRLNR